MSKLPKKIKVAQVITRMDWAGSPDIIRLLCEYADTEEFDIVLITGNSAHLTLENNRFLHSLGARYVLIHHLRRDVNAFYDLVALIRLFRLFRRERFDVVHTHTAKAGALGRMAARLAGVPRVVHTPHGHNFYGYFGAFASRLIVYIERFLGLFTNKIMALTELEKKDFLELKICPLHKVRVINSGVELEKFRSVDIDTSRKRAEFSVAADDILVGMVGRLEPVKGPQYLIEAAKLVLDKVPHIKFMIVGDGSLRASLETRCNQLGISDRVVFTNWREDIPQLLSILDVLVLPSLNEAVGRILLEAGAVGVPAVATYVGGVPEVVRDFETGLLVPPRSPEDLAKAIVTLAEDENTRKDMGRAAARWVDDKFSAQRMAQRILGLYLENG